MSQQSAAIATPLPARHGFFTDIWYGAVLGDFDRSKRVPGALVQIVFGYIPVVGSVCAVRDAIACVSQGDGLGVTLNVLSFVPMVGGLAKTLDVIHGSTRLREAAVRQRAAAGLPPRVKRGFFASVGVVLLLALFATIYGAGAGFLSRVLLDGGHALLNANLARGLGIVSPIVLVPFGLLLMLISSIMGRSWFGGILTPVIMLTFYLTALQMGLPLA